MSWMYKDNKLKNIPENDSASRAQWFDHMIMFKLCHQKIGFSTGHQDIY